MTTGTEKQELGVKVLRLVQEVEIGDALDVLVSCLCSLALVAGFSARDVVAQVRLCYREADRSRRIREEGDS